MAAAVPLTLAGLIAVLVLRNGGADSCAADPHGWNGAGGGPLHHGSVSTASGAPASRWTPVWSTRPVAAAADRLVAPPAAASGAVYTATASGALVALDAGDGHELWRSAPGPGETGLPRVTPAVDGCGVLVATSFADPRDGSPAGAVRAVGISDHVTLWGVTTGDDLRSAPQIVQGVAYLGVGVRTGSGLDRAYYLDGYRMPDGARDYRKQFRAALLASPASDGGHIWVGDLDDSVYALGPGGRQLWSFTTTGIVTAAVVPDGGQVLVAGDDGSLRALDAQRGDQRWSVDAGGPIDIDPVLSAGTAVVASRSGRVVAVTESGGRTLWTLDTGGRPVGMAASANRLAVVDGNGITAIDLATGRSVARWDAPAPPTGAPAIYDGRLLVACADGAVYALPF